MTMSSSLFTPASSSEAAKYQAILQSKIADGARRAGAVIQEIHTSQPTDRIVPTKKIGFEPAEGGIVMTAGSDVSLVPSAYALGQVAAKAGVPADYMRKLAAGDDWQRALAGDILTRHFHNGDAERALVRSVGGQMRGFLSDRFRRLDSRPLVDALAASAQKYGALPIDGVATETRVALKILIPQIAEPMPGEFMVYGAEWSNSDYGNGTHSLRTFALRVVCLNGMTRENLMRQIHLGGRLDENITFSERTYALDTRASVSALSDVVRLALGPGAVDRMNEVVRASHAKTLSEAQLRAATKNLPKKTQESVVNAFKSEDVINLPAGQTAWRGSNAVSWIARHTEDAEARLDLERLAGEMTAKKN